MTFDLSSIGDGFGIRPPRMFLCGTEKIGKSTFAACAPSPCFIPIMGEEGLDDIRDTSGVVIQVPQFPPSTCFADVKSALQSLLDGGHSYQTVVVDSASTLEPLMWNDVRARNDGATSIETVLGGYGKGYIEALAEWRVLTQYLDALRTHQNMASIIVGHVIIKAFNNPEGPDYDRYIADINIKAANLLYRWADAILFANTKVVVKVEKAGFGKETGKGMDTTGGHRFLFTQKRPAHPGGGRGVYGRLPYELPFSWEHYQAAVAAVAAQ